MLPYFLHQTIDIVIILVIIFVSGLLNFWQEKFTSEAMQHLLAIVTGKTMAWRDNHETDLPVVPDDVIPADCYLLMTNELFVNEAILTGKNFLLAKQSGVLPAATPLTRRRHQ